MRKHFLILFLMALLPLSGWAAIDISAYLVEINGTGAYVYNGTVQTVNLNVKMNNASELLSQGTDFTPVFYKSDGTTEIEEVKNVGTYYVAAKGKGGYTGTTTQKIQFTISAKLASALTVNLPEEEFTYDGTAKTFTGDITVKDGNAELTVNTDYTLSYDNNINAGTNTAKVIVTGTGNYQGTKEATFSINAKDLPTATTEGAYTFVRTNPTYTAANVTAANLPTITVVDADVSSAALVEGTDYEVKWYSEAALTNEVTPKDAITYYAKIVGKGNYLTTSEVSQATTSETINEEDLWKFTVAKKPIVVYVESKEKTYDSTPITVTVDNSEANITGVSIVATGIFQADNALKNDFKAKFVLDDVVGNDDDNYNTASGAPVNYAVNGYPMIAYATSGSTITKNYAPDYIEFGSYIINKRQVTVTAKTQTFTYDGTEKTPNLTAAYEGDAITIDIQAADNEAETGVVTGEEATVTGLVTLSKKEGVTILAQDTYKGAIVVAANADAAASNYTIVPVAGDVIVNGKALKVVAQNITEEYGVKVSDLTFNYLTNPTGVTLTKTPTYTLKNSDDDDFTNYEGYLPVDVYTITITPDATLAPTNYTIADDAYYEGELTITPKALTVQLAAQTLKVGDAETDLLQGEKYITITGLVGDEKVAYTIKGNTTFSTTTENTVGIDEAITAALVETTDASYDADIYSNGNYTFGTITMGKLYVAAASTIIMDRDEADLVAFLTANAGTAANQTVMFRNQKKLRAGQWNMMVLPFATTVPALSAVMKPNNATPGYAIVNVLNSATTSSDVRFELTMGAIPANTPFLIKTAAEVDLNTITAANVKIVAPTGDEVTGATYNGVTFMGIYHDKADLEDGEMTIKTDKKYYGARTGANLRPFEAYLTGVTVGARIFIEDLDENGTTAIKELNVDTMKAYAVDGWYTLNGVKLQAAPTEKGVYINNGKKVVIK